ncbi:hypothetical protein BZG36_01427 [Bifiguratus adelaidae]|uniref:GIT Spa2 homology (SHD) domain-containing protein n=1 Tax=Bifiguratus adelaidae TaxID=1938954 RepID=A0A261Y5G9_9FUNG|nr:hypothetical protein BZG36_01427 [Bifiguratus adelaidae]
MMDEVFVPLIGRACTGISVSGEVFRAFMIDDDNGQNASGKRISEVSEPLAKARFSIFYMSTYQTDFVLIKEKRLEQVVAYLHQSGFELDLDSLEENMPGFDLNTFQVRPSKGSDPIPINAPQTQPALSQSSGLLTQPEYSSFPSSYGSYSEPSQPLSSLKSDDLSGNEASLPGFQDQTLDFLRWERSVIANQLKCVGLDRNFVDDWAMSVMKVMFYPDLVQGYRTDTPRFFSYTASDEGISLITDIEVLNEFQPHWVNQSMDTPPMRLIQVDLSTGHNLDRYGIVRSIAYPLVEKANINLLYLSTFKTANVLVYETDLKEAESILEADLAAQERKCGLANSSRGTPSGPPINYEATAAAYHTDLEMFLEAILAKEAKQGPSPQRMAAREKLVRLSRQQFYELSTDVYDEMTRRIKDDKQVPFLPVRENFHPKRNQARQKLATLPKSRFKDLASDVFYELNRRYPNAKGSSVPEPMPTSRIPMPPMPNDQSKDKEASKEGGSSAKTTQIVPTTGTINIEPVGPDMMGSPVMNPPSSYGRTMTPTSNSNSENNFKSSSPPKPNGIDIDRSYPGSHKPSHSLSESPSSSSGIPLPSQSTPYNRDYPPQRHDLNKSPPNSFAGSPENNYRSLDGMMAELGGLNPPPSNSNYQPSTVPDRRPSNDDRVRDRGPTSDNDSLHGSDSHEDTVSLRRLEAPVSSNNARNQVMDEKMKNEYEERLRTMRLRVEELEAKNAALSSGSRSAKDSYTQNLEEEIEDLKQTKQQQQNRLQQLQEAYNRLEEEHNHHLETVDAVRNDMKLFLEETKDLASRNDELVASKEGSDATIKTLQAEVEEWKSKYQTAKAELRHIKSTSLFLRDPPVTNLDEDIMRPTAQGAVDQVHVIRYQHAIDELLRVSRTNKLSGVLTAMKDVVVACKAITVDIEKADSRGSLSAEKQAQVDEQKTAFSKALASLMTAAKNHASGRGITPVSLLDASAGQVTEAVVRLVEVFGMTAKREIQSVSSDEDRPLERSVKPAPMYHEERNITQLKRDDYGSLTPPKTPRDSDRAEEMDIRRYKQFLERQTDQLVESIQAVLTAVRANKGPQVTMSVATIDDIVGDIISTSRKAFQHPSVALYQREGEPILQDLISCQDDMVHLSNQLVQRMDRGGDETATRKLIAASYELAKYVKELIGLISHVKVDIVLTFFSCRLDRRVALPNKELPNLDFRPLRREAPGNKNSTTPAPRSRPATADNTTCSNMAHIASNFPAAGLLADKVVIITGASSGIGRATAIECARQGANVVIGHIGDDTSHASVKEVQALISQLGRQSIDVGGNVADPETAQHIVEEAVKAFGRVDVLVSNAGICHFHAFLDMPGDFYRKHIDVNLNGAFYHVQAAANQMKQQGGGGAIIAVSSISALVGGEFQTHYTPTKAGLLSLMQSTAIALGKYGIRCNAVLPGTIETDINREDLADVKKREYMEGRCCLGRLGEPEDLAGPIVFLASNMARYVTGASLLVDGGMFVNLQ